MQTHGILQHWAAAEELYAKHCPLEGFLVLYALLRGGSIPLYRRRVELRTRVRAAEMILFESHPASLEIPAAPVNAGSSPSEESRNSKSEENLGGKRAKRRRSGPSSEGLDADSSTTTNDPMRNSVLRHNPAQPPTPELARLVLQPVILKSKEYFAETRILVEITEEERDLQSGCTCERCCHEVASLSQDCNGDSSCSKEQKSDKSQGCSAQQSMSNNGVARGAQHGDCKSNGWSDDSMVPLALVVKVHVFLAVACRRRRQFAYALEVLMAAEKFIDDVVRQDPIFTSSAVAASASASASVSSSSLRQLAEVEVKCCAALVATELCRTLHTIATYVTENHELGKPMHRPVRAPHAAMHSIAPHGGIHAISAPQSRSGAHLALDQPRQFNGSSSSSSSSSLSSQQRHHRSTTSSIALAASSDLAQRELLIRSGQFQQYVSSSIHSTTATEFIVSRLCFTSALPDALAFAASCSSTLAAMHILVTLALEGTSAHANRQLSKCERLLGDVPELRMLRYFVEVGYEKSGSLASTKSIFPHAPPAENEMPPADQSLPPPPPPQCSWISHGTLAAMQALVDLCHHTTAPLPSGQMLSVVVAVPSNAESETSGDPRWTNRVQQIVADFNTVLEYVDQHINTHAASMGRSVGSATREGSNFSALRSSSETKNANGDFRTSESVSSALPGETHPGGTEHLPNNANFAASHTSELRFLVVVKCTAFVEVIRYFLSAMLLKEAFVRLLLLQRFMRVFKRQTSGFLCTVHSLTAELAMHLGIQQIATGNESVEDASVSESGTDVSLIDADSWSGSMPSPTPQNSFETGVGIAYSHLNMAELVTSNPALLLRTKLMKCLSLYRASQSTDVPHIHLTNVGSRENDEPESTSIETSFSGRTHVSTQGRLRQKCGAHAAELLAILKLNYDEFMRLREDSETPTTTTTTAAAVIVPDGPGEKESSKDEHHVNKSAHHHKYRRQILTEDQQRTLAAWTTSNCAFFLSLLGAVVLIDSKDEYSSAQYLKSAIAVARQRCGMLSPTVADSLLHLFHAHAAVTGGNTQEGEKALTLASQISARCEYWPCLMHCVALSQEKWCPSLQLDVKALHRVLNFWHTDVSYVKRNMQRELEEVLSFRVSA